MPPYKDKWSELVRIISKMSVEVCCFIAIPEFGLSWKEVAKAVRKAKLPMQSQNVARVLKSHLATTIHEDELEDILGRLQLQLVATENRKWHVVHLLEPSTEELLLDDTLKNLPRRLCAAFKGNCRGTVSPLVESIMLEDLIYVSIKFQNKKGTALYLAVPPGQPLALFSKIPAEKVLKSCAEGLGYGMYDIASLHGKDKGSLLRIASKYWTAEGDHLTQVPEYRPVPTITSNGIDYTCRSYNEQYIDCILGPDPPVLTDLNIKAITKFVEPNLLNQTISMSLTLKSEDVAKTLRAWALKGAISPDSEFFKIFHQIKSNQITIDYPSD